MCVSMNRWLAVAAAAALILAPAQGPVLAIPLKLAWGEGVEGVQVRLRAKQSRWKEGEVPRLWANVRNQGKRNLFVAPVRNRCELEVDGRWYRPPRTLERRLPPEPFPPSRQYDNIAVDLHESWELAASRNVHAPWDSGRGRLRLTPGKHTVRVAFTAWASKKARAPIYAPGEDVRAVSNPIQIEILPKSDKKVDATQPAKASATSAEPTVEATGVKPDDQPPTGSVPVGLPPRAEGVQKALPVFPSEATLPGSIREASLIIRGEGTAAGATSVRYKVSKVLRGKLTTDVVRMAIRENSRASHYPLGRDVIVFLKEPRETDEGVIWTGFRWFYDDSPRRLDDQEAAILTTIANLQSPWGQAVEGVQVRLRAKQSKWNQGTVPRLWADVRNQGKRNLLVTTQSNRCELEVGGRWYWGPIPGGGRMRPQPFPPGRQYDDIAVDVHGAWELAASRVARTPWEAELKLTPGKHTIRVAFTATAAKNAPDRNVRAISKPVVIEIVAESEQEVDATEQANAGATVDEPTTEATGAKPDDLTTAVRPAKPSPEGGKPDVDTDLEKEAVFDMEAVVPISEPKLRAVMGRSLTAPVARKGEIQIGGRQYTALLAEPGTTAESFDRPEAVLLLTPADNPKQRIRYYETRLGAIREIDGKY